MQTSRRPARTPSNTRATSTAGTPNCSSAGSSVKPGGIAAAKAGRLDRNFRARLRQIEPLFDQRPFDVFAAADQAFVQPVQRPQIIGVLAGAAQFAVEPEIGAVNLLRLGDPALLEQERA